MTATLRRRFTAVAVMVLVLPAVVVPALATPPTTVRDEFNRIGYDGDDGSDDWSGDWREVPLSDGPTAGQIQVVADAHCVASNCLRLGPDNMIGRGILREVDLSGETAATLTFSYRRQMVDAAADGKVWLRVSNDGWTWTTLRTYDISGSDSSQVVESVSLDAWTGDQAMIIFLGGGTLNGHMFIDDVQVAMSSNEAPVFDELLPDRSDTEGDAVTIVPEVTDPDGDDVDFSASGLPPGVSINSDTGVISGVLGYSAAGSSPYTTVVKASDGSGGNVSDSFVWAVADVNRAPALPPIANVLVDEGSAMQVTTSASDPDLPDDTLEFTLIERPSGASVNSSGLITWTRECWDPPDLRRPGQPAAPGHP